MRPIALFVLCAITLSAKVLTFGVVPQQSTMEMVKNWQPFVEYLEKATGEKITLKIERSIPEFEKVLYSGGYDLAYMNPYHYVIAHKKSGYTAAIRDEKNVVGILVVQKNGALRDVSMVKGKKFLFPAPDAFAATLLIKYELLKKYGIDINKENNYRYVNSHDSVYKGVARGIGDCGGGIERTLNDLQDNESKNALTVLYKTKAYPSHPFAFHPSVPSALKEKLTNAIVQIPDNYLTSLSMKHMRQTDDVEYESVRDVAAVLPGVEE